MIRLAPSVAALGFAAPWMLLWLPSLALPWILHRWRRRNCPVVPWAATRFLQQAAEQGARALRWRDRLLLALRTLLLLAVILAAADPFWARSGTPHDPRGPAHKVYVVDVSYSMTRRSGTTSPIAKARRIVTTSVRASRPGDTFSLVLMSSPPWTTVRSPTRDVNAFLRDLDSITLPECSADIDSTLQAVSECIEQVQQTEPRPSRTEIVFVSDMGKRTWQPLVDSLKTDTTSATRSDPRRERWIELARRTAVSVADVGQDLAQPPGMVPPHRGIVGMQAGSGGAAADGLTVTVEVENFADSPADSLQVQLQANGLALPPRQISLPPRGRGTVEFDSPRDGPGQYTFEAHIDNDLLETDNRRQLVLLIAPQRNVLCVAGAPGAADMLSLALSASQTGDPRSQTKRLSQNTLPRSGREGRWISAKVISLPEVADESLGAWDAVIFSNCEFFTPDEYRRLTEYVRQGGGSLLFLGNRIRRERYNDSAVPGGDGCCLLPLTIGPRAEQGNYRLDPLDYRHPLIEAFRDHERSGLLSTPVSQYWKLGIGEQNPTAQVALAFRNGDPAVVTAELGRGRIVCVATSASIDSDAHTGSPPWTLLPVWPSFLPLVRECLDWITQPHTQRHNLLVGEPIEIPLTPRAGTHKILLHKPDGSRSALQIPSNSGPTFSLPGETLRGGLYTVEWSGLETDNLQLAVNPDTAESDLTRVDPQDLVVLSDGFDRRRADLAGATARFPDDIPADSSSGPTDASAARSIVRPLLNGAMACMLFESLVAAVRWPIRSFTRRAPRETATGRFRGRAGIS